RDRTVTGVQTCALPISPFLIRSTFSLCAPLFGLRLATKKAYARRVHNELCRWRCLQRLRLHCLHLWQTNGLLDADALRSRINAVAALCGRCCFACRQHASGNGGNRLSPYLDRQKNRAAIQRIIRSAEATFACCRCNSEMLTRPIDGEIHFLD